MPSDGPAGRSMPTSPQTSIFAAVTQALPGPTMRSTGSRPASGQAVRQRPDRLRATGDDEGVDLEQARSPQQDRVVGAGAVGRGGDDDPLHARDLRGDHGHHQ